jgi:hypothetical protein
MEGKADACMEERQMYVWKGKADVCMEGNDRCKGPGLQFVLIVQRFQDWFATFKIARGWAWYASTAQCGGVGCC